MKKKIIRKFTFEPSDVRQALEDWIERCCYPMPKKEYTPTWRYPEGSYEVEWTEESCDPH